jgi:hypothetical protein
MPSARRALRCAYLIVLFLSFSWNARAQNDGIDLAKFGYRHAPAGHPAPPAFSAISYVGEDTLFVTFPAQKQETVYGKPFDYTAVALHKDGFLIAKSVLSGLWEDQLQHRFIIQPKSKVLIVSSDELRIYDLDLVSFKSFKLPEKPQLRLSPDRKTIVVISKEGNEALETTISLPEMNTTSQHLHFDELAVRDAELAVSNTGAVAHAVRDPGAELSISVPSVRWPPQFTTGKYQEPLSFIAEDQLLVSATATTPFPPTYLYIWKADGSIQKIRGPHADLYRSAQPSSDGKRILVTETDVNFFTAMLGGFDCGDCGESNHYSIIDVPSAKALFKRPSHWNCTQALSPSGKEIAELCDGIIRFLPVP